MSKFYKTLSLTIFFIMITVMLSFAQDVTRNLVVVEEFTGTWCVYCPGAALGIEDLIANDWPVAAIGYHNNDAFTTTEGLARDSYYGNIAYPTTIFDGLLENLGGDPNNSIYEEFVPLVEERLAVLTPITAYIENSNYDGTTYTADVVMEAVGSVTSTNTVMFAVITESQIVEQWQSMYYLMEVERAMFNGADGTPVDLVNNTSETVSIEFTVDLAWEATNCEVVVFVQDTETKEIFNGDKEHVLHLEPATNLEVNANGQDVTLQWDAPEALLGYNIYRDWEFLEYTEEITYIDDGLEDGA